MEEQQVTEKTIASQEKPSEPTPTASSSTPVKATDKPREEKGENAGAAEPGHKGTPNKKYNTQNRNQNRNNYRNNRNNNDNRNNNNNNNNKQHRENKFNNKFGGPYNNSVKYGGKKRDAEGKKVKEDAPYGNYEFYYGYRPAGVMDPRTKLFSKEMFYQKRCLDIGCNSGHFTIQIAIQFEPRYMLGLDIDKQLISKAQQNVLQVHAARSHPKKIANKDQKTTETTESTPTQTTTATEPTTQTTTTTTEEKKVDIVMEDKTQTQEENKGAEDAVMEAGMPSTLPARPTIDGVPYFPICFTDIPKEALDLPREVFFPNNVRFKNENYIERDEVTERYDAIFCLSVSKWVQLNWGDEGIKKMFHKIYNSLYEGGIFVFEPQPWGSYKKRARISEGINSNYKNIKLKPEEYSSYLTSQVGFKTVQVMAQPAGTPKGFDRPVYLYTK